MAKVFHKPPERIGGTLESILYRLDPKGSWILYRLMRVWPQIVGEAISRRSEVASINLDTAIIKVSSPVWIQELSALKGEILSKLHEQFPDIPVQDLHFVLGRVKSKTKRKHESYGLLPKKAAVGARVKDPKLQEVLDRLIERWGRTNR